MGIGICLYPLGPNATILGFDDDESLSMLIVYDYVIYTIMFTLGLLWTHLDSGILGQIDLTWASMQRMTPSAMVVFGLLVLGGLALVAFQLFLLELKGLLWWYIAGYGALIAIIALVTFLVRKTHTLHIHHYILFALIVPLTCTQDITSIMIQGYSLGVFVEGIARWGADPLFERIETES